MEETTPVEDIYVEESSTGDDVSASEAALMSQFKTLVEVPTYMREAFDRMQNDRDFVAELNEVSDPGEVRVNQILKNQQTVISNLGIDDPRASCKPTEVVGGKIDPVMLRECETMQIFLNRQGEQMRLAEILEGAAQDALTNGISYIKISLQEDFYKDPVGQNRFNDQQENVAEYERLKEQYEAGEMTEDCADYQRLKDLDLTLKTWMAEKIAAQPTMIPQDVIDPMTGQIVTQMVPDPQDPRTERKMAIINGEMVDLIGCPELERYLGFVADQLLPEDVRFDWSVTRPEDIRRGEWMAYRVFMSQEKIAAQFRLDPEEWRKINVYNAEGRKTDRRWGSLQPSARPNLEDNQINDRCAVWTLEHRVQGRRYVWVDGMSKFLANEPMQAVGANPFSIFPIYFNRVSGRAMPQSDVQLQRDLQNEYNMLRTHDKQARKASYPWNIVAAGAADKEDIAAIEARRPFQAVMLKKADDISKYFREVAGSPYNPNTYDTSKVVADMQMMASVPLTGLGVQGEGAVATDLSLANQGMQKAISRRQNLMNRTLTDIYTWIAQVAVKVFPAENIKAMCGPEAVWLALSAEQLTMNMQIGVKASVSGPPDFKSQLQFFTALPDILGKLMAIPGMNVEAVAEKLMALGGINDDIRKYWSAPMMQPMGVPPGMPQDPTMQGDRGVEGGAPPMQGAPAPDSIPNNPNNRLGV